MQVENEVGVLGDSRDHIAAANDAYAKPVPADLMNYLVRHKETLAPELLQVWEIERFQDFGELGGSVRPGQAEAVHTSHQHDPGGIRQHMAAFQLGVG